MNLRIQLNIDILWGVLSTLLLLDQKFDLQLVSFLGSYKTPMKDIGTKAAKRVLKYLKVTHEFGLKYSKVDEFKLVGHTYSNFDGDKENGVSTS
jgi:hypothetical protein